MKIVTKSSPNENWYLPQEDADEFLQAVRRGQQPPTEQLIEKFPEHADAVRRRCRLMLFTQNLVANTGANHISVPPAPDLAALGEYRILRLLGRGGMGFVYEATQPGLSRHVAIKVLADLPVHVNRLRQRFAVEAEAASRLNHPNIVSVFDYGEDQNLKYLVMRYVDGCGLDLVIKSRSKTKEPSSEKLDVPAACLAAISTWEKIAAIGAQAAAALHHAHQRGMIHRDIKPANLLLDKSEQVHIADFGLAKINEEDSGITRAGDSIGTPRYMSPEALRGKADKRSDIFGLGVTLWELTTRYEAFGDASASGMLKQRSVLQLPAPHNINPQIPEALSDIIMRACASELEDRYQSAEEFQQDLNAFAHGSQPKSRRKRDNPAPRSSWLAWKTPIRLCLGFGLAFAISFFLLRTPAKELNGATGSQHVTGAPEFIGMADDRIVDVHLPDGTTSFNDVKLQCYDPEGLCAMYRIVGGPDADLFAIHPDSGTVLFRHKPSVVRPHDADNDSVYEIDVAVTDSIRAESMQFLDAASDGGLGTFEPVRSVLSPAPWADSAMNNSLICIETADGKTFYHCHEHRAGSIALYRTERDKSGIWLSPTLLHSDCGLPSNARGWCTADGSTFLCLTSSSNVAGTPTQLYQCELLPTGELDCRKLSDDCGIPSHAYGLWSYDDSAILYFVPSDGQLEQWFAILQDDGTVSTSIIAVGPRNSQLTMVDTTGWIQSVQQGSSNRPARVRIHIGH